MLGTIGMIYRYTMSRCEFKTDNIQYNQYKIIFIKKKILLKNNDNNKSKQQQNKQLI